MSQDRVTGHRPSDAMERRLAAIAAADHAVERWRPNRLILHDYWLYPYQEFHFAAGKLVLRGQNGAGKSTVLATAVTLVLDGDKRSERMDTLGTNTKNIADYLIGPKEAKEGDPLFAQDRTAFIALEFRLGRKEVYKTIGLSIRAQRHSGSSQPKLTSWYFLVGDGRRCGKGRDIEFSRMEGADEVTYTQNEMEERITGEGNFAGTRRADYQHEVNKEVFGFVREQGYRYLMQVLLTLRSPKLGKGLKPDEACDMLADALPPLDGGLLEKITRMMDDIDATQQKVRETEQQRDLLQGVERAQAALARYHAQAAAVDYQQAAGWVREASDELERRRAAAERAKADEERIGTRVQELRGEKAEVEGRLQALQDSALYRRHEQLGEVEEWVRKADCARADAKRDLLAARNSEEQAEGMLADETAAWMEKRGSLLEQIDPLIATAEAKARWGVARRPMERAQESLIDLDPGGRVQPPDLAFLRSEKNERVRGLEDLKKRIVERGTALNARKEAEAREEEQRERLEEAEADVRKAEIAVSEERRLACEEVRSWADIVEEASPDPDDIERALENIAALESPPRSEKSLLVPILRRLESHRQALDGEAQRVRTTLASAQSRLDHWQEQLDEWCRGESENRPPARPGQEAFREALAEAGIVARPLYAICDIREGTAPETASRVEHALEEAGLLDALVAANKEAAQVAALVATDPARLGDRWIRSEAVSGRTLFDVLEPTVCDLPPEDVERALRSVSIEGRGATAIDLDGHWTLGALAGRAREGGPARFIGETNRRRAWQVRRDEFEYEVRGAEAAVRDAGDRLEVLTERQQMLEQERVSLEELPRLRTLGQALAGLKDRRERRDREVRAHEKAVLRVEEAQRALDEKEEALNRAVGAHPEARGLSADAVGQLIFETKACFEAFRTLVSQIADLGSASARITKHQETLERARRVRKDGTARVAGAEEGWRKVRARLNQLTSLLEDGGVTDMLAEVERGKVRLSEIEEESGTLQRKWGEKGEARRHAQAAAKTAVEGVAERKERLETAIDTLEQALGAYPSLAGVLERLVGESPAAAARELLKEREGDLESMRARVADDQSKAPARLSKAMFEDDRDRVLDGFRPFTENINGVTVALFRAVPGRSGTLNASELLEIVEVEHRMNQQLVRQGEEKLYEEFLFGEVADNVRAAMQDAREATEHINSLLARTPISDEKIIGLAWQPRSSLSSGGIGADYKRIVSLLERSAAVLRPEQAEEVKGFFRERIAEVRERERAGTSTKRFSEALHEVLDYRRWFAYEIRLKEGDGSPRSLTTVRHGKLSGAEQALSVFMPLMAAADARYRDASVRAPKIVAMDEAFSGVDPKNTAAVWQFMAQLDFSWVMSSEKLWGAGPSLSACSTYNFIRRGAVAAVSLWLWDGRTRIRDGGIPESDAAAETQSSIFDGAAKGRGAA